MNKAIMGALVALTASLLLAAHCEDVVVPGPAPHDAGTPADCASACEHLRALKCPEGEPTPKGATCEDVCNHTESSGTVTLWPGCVAKIQACDEIDACTYGSNP